MSGKDSKSKLIQAFHDSNIRAEPTLAAAYRAAVMSVCGVEYVHVSEWDYPRFENRQRELQKAGINCDDFAAAVVKTWWGWCQTLGMSVVSVPIFCGPKAYARYCRDLERHPTVKIDTLGEDVYADRLHEEYQVAMAIIGNYPDVPGNVVRIKMEPFLKYPTEINIINDVVHLLNRMYHMSATNYKQIAKELHRRSASCQVSFQLGKPADSD